MSIQKVYLSNVTSSRTPVTAVKIMEYSTGTLDTTSTSASPNANKVVQFIPGTANNNTTFTIGTTPVSKGWLFESEFPGLFYPGTWTVSAAITNNFAANTGQLGCQIYLVNPGATTVNEINGISTGLFSSAATALAATTQTFTATFNLGTTLQIYPNQYLYLELYWTTTNRFITTVRSALNLESTNTFLQTSFFKPSMSGVDGNAAFQLLNIG